MVEADAGLVEVVFGSFTKCLALPLFRIQEIKIAIEQMERIEALYYVMVQELGLDRIGTFVETILNRNWRSSYESIVYLKNRTGSETDS
jgi:hypothetical protein